MPPKWRSNFTTATKLVANHVACGCKEIEADRLALRRGDIAEAAKHGRVFEMTPVAAK